MIRAERKMYRDVHSILGNELLLAWSLNKQINNVQLRRRDVFKGYPSPKKTGGWYDEGKIIDSFFIPRLVGL